MKLKYFILIICVSIGVYYGLKLYAAYRIQVVMHSCGKVLGISEKIKLARSEPEFRAVSILFIECIDERVTFPTSLFFNKQESIDSIKINKSK